MRTAAGLRAAGLGLALVPEVRVFAQQVQEFLLGPPVPDVQPEQLSPHVWMVYAKEGFPTQDYQGLMASVVFVVTQKGVVVLDSGALLQIRLHHHGRAHTPSDLCFEIVQDRLTYVGDIAMENLAGHLWHVLERHLGALRAGGQGGLPLDGAKALVMKDSRVASRAKTMAGFDSNIGKYTSLAYLEAEKEAF